MLIALTLFAEYPLATRLTMSDDTTTQSASTKSTFPHLSWQGVRTPLRQFATVFLLILMTPSIASLVLIWPSADMLHKGGHRYQRRQNPWRQQ